MSQAPYTLHHNTLDVLRVLADDPDVPTWGHRIAEQLELIPRSVYPILSRLLRDGWLEDHWEDNPENPNLTKRHMYLLTPEGLAKARQLLDEAPDPYDEPDHYEDPYAYR